LTLVCCATHDIGLCWVDLEAVSEVAGAIMIS